jgi:hypothetical protein
VPGIKMQKARNYGDRNFGGPYIVNSEIMAEVFEAATQDILQMLKFE